MSKGKLSAHELALKKAEEKKQKKENKPISKKGASRLGVESTTHAHSHPIRFLTCERNIIQSVMDSINENDKGLVRELLGSDGFRHINMTKIVRAAVYLLQGRSNEEIISAIVEAKENMYQDA